MHTADRKLIPGLQQKLMAVIIGCETSPGIPSGKQEGGWGRSLAGYQHQDTSVGCLHSEGAAAAVRRGEKIHIYTYIYPACYHAGFLPSAQMVEQFSGVFVEVT